jgi:hypothetical protein
VNAEAKRTLRRRARGRVAQGKHRKIPKAQANRRPDPESLPTATARSALGVSDPEDVRESALLTQDFAAGVGGRRAAEGVRRCGREREKRNGGTLHFSKKNAGQSCTTRAVHYFKLSAPTCSIAPSKPTRSETYDLDVFPALSNKHFLFIQTRE